MKPTSSLHSHRGVRARFAATAVLAAGSLLLAGCSTPAEEGASDSSTLTVWHYFTVENQVQVMEDYADLFEENNPETTVENVFVPYDQLNSKLIAAVGAQSGPDVVVFNGAEMGTLALAGALAPMTDRWNSYEDKGEFPESTVLTLDDEIYAAQGYVNLLGLWYNADLLEEVGVEPPTTIDELNTALDQVVAAGKQGITLSARPQSQGEWQAYPWLSSFGFDYEDPQAEPLEEAFTMVQGWTESGALSREAVTWDQTVPFQTFAAGDVAFAENGNWQIGTANDTASFEYGVVPLPVGSEGQVYLGGEGEAVGAFAKDPDLAWKYLTETFYSSEGQLIALNGAGTIPSRADTAEDPAVTDNPLLAAFAEAIEANGATYPSPAIPAAGIADQQLGVGQIWSAVVGGQSTPEQAAQDVLTQLESIQSE